MGAKLLGSQAASASGGGKVLGRGGAKRLRKVRDDNTIQGITKPVIRSLARRGGVKRIYGLVYEETGNMERS